MATIQANGSKGHHQFILNITESGTSVANNTSTVSFIFVLNPITAGYSWSNGTVSYTVSVNGTKHTGTIPSYDGASTLTVKSGTMTIPHNTDGTKVLSYYFTVTDTTGASNTCGNANASGSTNLTTLERPASGSAPIITASVVDTNSTTINLTGSSSTLIKYHSNARATMTATAQGGAAIDNDMYIIRNGDETVYSSSGTFYDVESDTFTFSAQDSAGRIGTATVTADMIDYVKLTCNMGNSRPDANGDMTLTCSGNYFNGSFGAYSNTLSVQYSYTGSDGSSGSGYMTVNKSGNTYYAYAYLSGLNYQVTYSFVITATDRLETATNTESGVKSKPVFHWGENDFVFEVPVTFNSGFSNKGEDVAITGNLRLKADGKNYGNTIYFGDGIYAYISEPSDDVLTIYASNGINLNSNGSILVNGAPIGSGGSGGGGGGESGTWNPRLSSSAVSSYYYQYGWYQKVGNVVTIGWYIMADVNSGYHTTPLIIYGWGEDELSRYTPACSAFGGGVAFNVYTSVGGIVFEGWSIGTDGGITARFQPCNNTTAGNLSISSSCYFPSGGGTMTLGGTICFMTNS